MPRVDCVKSTAIVRSPRVIQLEGLFDVPPAERSEQRWQAELPLEERDWTIGLIVGPSGCGKSTVARELFGPAVVEGFDWPADEALVDGFPGSMSVKRITQLLSSVGFSSPPSWLRPFGCLSTGEQFRATMARALAEASELTVIDEFTSVVDRTVARIGSAAIAKTVRRGGCGRFVAVSCHSDVIDWLDPDWIYRPADNSFEWRDEAAGDPVPGRRRPRRPAIELEARRVHRRAWQLFAHHHYLSARLHPTCDCYCGFVDGRPAVFTAVVHFPHARFPGWREHRTVCLPDFQGVGIGNAMSELIASLYVADGSRYYSVTSNPAMIRHRARSPQWRMTRRPQLGSSRHGSLRSGRSSKAAGDRLVASFRYVGSAASDDQIACMSRDPSVYVPAAGGERVIEALRQQPGLTVGALRRKARLSGSEVRRVLGELVREGVVERAGRGGAADPYTYRLVGEPR